MRWSISFHTDRYWKNTSSLSFSLSGIDHSIDDGNTEKPDFDGAQISGPTLTCPMFLD